MIRAVLLHFWFADYVVALANNLIEHVDLTLIHPEYLSEYHEILDPRIQSLTFKKPRLRDPRNVFAMSEMMRLIRRVQPDVLHMQENDPWYDLTLLLNKVPPLVTTIHDVFRHPGDRNTLAYEPSRRIAFYRSQQLIVHTPELKQVLTHQFRVPAQRVNVLAHGELGRVVSRWTDGKLLPREPHTLLFFGRIWPYKGLKYLIEAMPLIAKQIPDVKLIIAGKGESLGKYFPDGHDERHFEILNGFIPKEEVAGLFQRSAITVLPYIESSQSGVAAMSYGLGTPVIASNVGGLREMVRHGEDGLLVPPEDVPALASAVIQLLSNDTLQIQFQKAAFVRCQEDLNWATIAAQTAEVYQMLAESA